MVQAHQQDQQINAKTASKNNTAKVKPSYKHIPHSQKPPHLVAKRNARERRRVQAVNQAFYKLRKCVPIENRNKRVSKVKTLQRAIDYIRKLERILAEDDNNEQQPYTQLVSGSTNVRGAAADQTKDGAQQGATSTTTSKKISSSINKCDRVNYLDSNQASKLEPQIIKQKRGRKALLSSTATAAQAPRATDTHKANVNQAPMFTINQPTGSLNMPPDASSINSAGMLNCNQQQQVVSSYGAELDSSSSPATVLELQNKFNEPYYSTTTTTTSTISQHCPMQLFQHQQQQEILRESSAYNNNLNYNYNEQQHHHNQIQNHPNQANSHLGNQNHLSQYQHPQNYLNSAIQEASNQQIHHQQAPSMQQAPFDSRYTNNIGSPTSQTYGPNSFYNNSSHLSHHNHHHHIGNSSGYSTADVPSTLLNSYNPQPMVVGPPNSNTVPHHHHQQRQQAASWLSNTLKSNDANITLSENSTSSTSSPSLYSLSRLNLSGGANSMAVDSSSTSTSITSSSSFATSSSSSSSSSASNSHVQSPLSSSSSTNCSSQTIADSSDSTATGNHSSNSDNSSTIVCRPRSTTTSSGDGTRGQQVNSYLTYAMPLSSPNSNRMEARASHLSFAVTSTTNNTVVSGGGGCGSRSSSCSSGGGNVNTSDNNDNNISNAHRHQQPLNGTRRSSKSTNNAEIADRETNTSYDNGHQVRHLLSGAHPIPQTAFNSNNTANTGLSLANNNLHEQLSHYHRQQHNHQLQQSPSSSFQILNNQHHLNRNHLSSSPLLPLSSSKSAIAVAATATTSSPSSSSSSTSSSSSSTSSTTNCGTKSVNNLVHRQQSTIQEFSSLPL